MLSKTSEDVKEVDASKDILSDLDATLDQDKTKDMTDTMKLDTK